MANKVVQSDSEDFMYNKVSCLDETKIDRALEIILSLISLIYFFVFAIINLLPSKYGLSSDIAQTGICSRAFWEGGSLHPSNFVPWSESGIFSLALLGAPIYGVTGSIWMAQCIPPVIVTILVIFAIKYALKSFKIASLYRAFFIFFVFAFPLGYYTQSMTFLLYAAYSLCVFSMFWVLGDFLRLIQNELRHKWVHFGIQIFFAFFQGLNSSRGVLMVYTPLLLLELYRYVSLMIKNKRIVFFEEIGKCVFCVGLWMTSYFATYLPWSVKTSGSIELKGAITKLLTQVLPALGREIGLIGNASIIQKIIIFITLLITLFVVINILFTWNSDNKLQNAIMFMLINLILTIGMLTVMNTSEVSQRYFVVVFYLIGLAIIYFCIKIIKKKKIFEIGLISILLLYGIFNLPTNYLTIISDSMQSDKKNEKDVVIEWMVSNDIYYAYADYLDANALTVYSDGKVQVSSIILETLNMCWWTTDKNWYVPNLPQDMQTVYIVNKENIKRFASETKKMIEVKEIFETEHFVLYMSEENYSELR